MLKLAMLPKFQAYYNVLCKTVEKHGLKDHHACKYNMDESEVPLIHMPPKVIAVKGTRNVHYRTSGKMTQITIIACSNAIGSIIPSMVIFKGQKLNTGWTIGAVRSMQYRMSQKGWTECLNSSSVVSCQLGQCSCSLMVTPLTTNQRLFKLPQMKA